MRRRLTPTAPSAPHNLCSGSMSHFAVFDKATGARLYGPAAGNTLWSGFGGGCQTNNDGDPIVQYDKAANRWIFTQFSVSTTPYLQCVAVSTDLRRDRRLQSLCFSATDQFPRLSQAGRLARRLLHHVQHVPRQLLCRIAIVRL